MSKPVQSYKKQIGSSFVGIAIWMGNYGPSLQFSVRYKDKTSGEWVDKKSLFTREADALLELLSDAVVWCKSQEFSEVGTASFEGQEKSDVVTNQPWDDDDGGVFEP